MCFFNFLTQLALEVRTCQRFWLTKGMWRCLPMRRIQKRERLLGSAYMHRRYFAFCKHRTRTINAVESFLDQVAGSVPCTINRLERKHFWFYCCLAFDNRRKGGRRIESLTTYINR